MITANGFLEILLENNINFFTGVPDSQLKEFCTALVNKFGISNNHLISPNEGNAVALAAGHYLSTGKAAMVYMQNSGIGNAANPILSLTDSKVYNIPILYLIGWRGTPGVPDEPQHIKQGEITLELLKILGIECHVLEKDTTLDELKSIFDEVVLRKINCGQSVALVAKKGVFTKQEDYAPKNVSSLLRESVIEIFLDNMKETDIVVSTTGKTSRELYELRDKKKMSHNKDFLTVGSMGHASMIALKISLNRKDRRIWCLDGDGAAIMHMGSLGLIGAQKPTNFIHIVLNNFSHESVGGFPTFSENIDYCQLAESLGYDESFAVSDEKGLLEIIKNLELLKGPILICVNVSNVSRENLGRPKTTPIENKIDFMKFLEN